MKAQLSTQNIMFIHPPEKELIFRAQVTFQLECEATNQAIEWKLPTLTVRLSVSLKTVYVFLSVT